MVSHSGIDWENTDPSKIESLELKKPSVTYAGSFHKGRGLELIIKLSELLPNINFYLIGYVDDYQIENKRNNINLIKRLNRNKLLKYLKSSDILIAPYNSKSLGIDGKNISEFQSPLKLIEYLSTGKPIISTNIGAPRDHKSIEMVYWLMKMI